MDILISLLSFSTRIINCIIIQHFLGWFSHTISLFILHLPHTRLPWIPFSFYLHPTASFCLSLFSICFSSHFSSFIHPCLFVMHFLPGSCSLFQQFLSTLLSLFPSSNSLPILSSFIRKLASVPFNINLSLPILTLVSFSFLDCLIYSSLYSILSQYKRTFNVDFFRLCTPSYILFSFSRFLSSIPLFRTGLPSKSQLSLHAYIHPSPR